MTFIVFAFVWLGRVCVSVLLVRSCGGGIGEGR